MAELRSYVPRVEPTGAVGGPKLSGGDLDPGFGARQSAAGSALGARRRAIDAEARAGAAEAGVATARAEAADAWGSAGEATRQLGDTLAAIDEQSAKAARAAKLADAKARFTLNQQSFAGYLQYGDGKTPPPPPAKHLELYDKHTKELLKQAEKEFGDDLASFGAFRNEFEQVTLNHRLDVLKHKIETERSASVATLENGLRTTALSMARTNPRTRGPLLASAEQAVYDQETAGNINPEQRQRLLKGFFKDVSDADADRMVYDRGEGDPWRAEAHFRENPLAGWDAADQQRWIDKAQREQDRRNARERAEEARADSQAKERQRLRRETVEKDLIDARRNGDPTLLDKIEAARGVLTADQYRMHLDAATKPREIIRNDRAYVDLMQRAARASKLSQSEKDAVLDDARSLAIGSKPSLKVEDYDRIRNELQGSDKRPRWHAPGKAYITTGLQGGAAAIGIGMSDDKALRLANALDDWDRWSNDHPDAADNDAEAVYKRIVRNARSLETAGAPDIPMQYVVNTTAGVDYQATAGQIWQDLLNRRIAPSEFARHMSRLNRAEREDPVLERRREQERTGKETSSGR